MKPSILLRVASIITLLYFAGHTAGMPWTPAAGPGELPVIEAMKTHRFGTEGFARTYWDFYFGFGLIISAFLLVQAVVLWQLQIRPIIASFLVAFVVNAILAWMFWKTRSRYEPGKLVGAFIFFYGIFRFGLEFIREPDQQLVAFAQATHLHMGQWLSLPMIIGGLYLMLTASKRRVRIEPTAGTAPVA